MPHAQARSASVMRRLPLIQESPVAIGEWETGHLATLALQECAAMTVSSTVAYAGFSASSPLTDDWPSWLPMRQRPTLRLPRDPSSGEDVAVDRCSSLRLDAPSQLGSVGSSYRGTLSSKRRARKLEKKRQQETFLSMLDHFHVRAVHPTCESHYLPVRSAHEAAQYSAQQRRERVALDLPQSGIQGLGRLPAPKTALQTATTASAGPRRALSSRLGLVLASRSLATRKWKRLHRWFSRTQAT